MKKLKNTSSAQLCEKARTGTPPSHCQSFTADTSKSRQLSRRDEKWGSLPGRIVCNANDLCFISEHLLMAKSFFWGGRGRQNMSAGLFTAAKFGQVENDWKGWWHFQHSFRKYKAGLHKKSCSLSGSFVFKLYSEDDRLSSFNPFHPTGPFMAPPDELF